MPLVISRKRGERHDPLALNFQNALVGNGERNALDRPHLRGDDFAYLAVSARRRLRQDAVFVSQVYRQTVELIFDRAKRHLSVDVELFEPSQHFFLALAFVKAEQLSAVTDLFELGKRLVAHPNSGRIGQNDAAALFESDKFVIKPVVFAVGNYRIVEHIITIGVIVELLYEFMHSVHIIHLGS